MSPAVIERDISAFLQNELGNTRDAYNFSVPEARRLPSSWPSQSDIQALTRMAIPLFIFAATVCRFIADRKYGNPDRQLRKVLDYGSKGHGSKLDMTYSPVLYQQLDGASTQERDEILSEFHRVVGAIVVLATPLSTASLSRLLRVPQDTIDARLDMLHSVLSIPASANSPVRLLHLSFRDYLVDPTNRQAHPFWVDEAWIHRNLAEDCLLIMDNHLQENICRVQGLGTRRSAIDPQKIEAGLPPELQYACVYWVHHKAAVGMGLGDARAVYDFLRRHFLHWLEALSLIGRVSESLTLIRMLQRLLEVQRIPNCDQPGQSQEPLDFLTDAVRFVLANQSVIDTAPLQIYSALLFAPTKTIIRKTFEAKIPRYISQRPHMEASWDPCLQKLEGHGDSVRSVAFSHNSALVASASDDRTIRLWTRETGKCVQILRGHGGIVGSVVFSHDSNLVASASDDKTVRIWCVSTGRCRRVLEGHGAEVTSVAFSHNSALVVSASRDKTAQIWGRKTGRCEHILEGHGDWVNSVAFSHDSTLVASASNVYNQAIGIWSVEAGICEQVLRGHSGGVNSVVFSHDSALIASASADRTLRIWHRESARCITVIKGHSAPVYSVAFSYNSALVVSASVDETIRIWSRDTGKCEQVLKDHSSFVTSAAFSHDSMLIVSASLDSTVRIWSRETGNYRQTLESHSDIVVSVAFSPDLTLVASAGDRTIRIWNPATGLCERVLEGHSSYIAWVDFSHDSTLVVSATVDDEVRIWSRETGKCAVVLKGIGSKSSSVAFSHDSTLAVAASHKGAISIWSVETGGCVRVLNGHTNSLCAITFSHDATLLASASGDKTVRIWSRETWDCLRVLEGHSDWVNDVTFSHDSTLIASGSRDKTIRIWTVERGECVRVFEGHSHYVCAVAFSHNSTLVAAASLDKTIRVWSLETGSPIRIAHLESTPRQLSFVLDNARVITDDGAVDLDLELRGSSSSSSQCLSSPVAGLGVRDNVSWITWHGQDFLWLPVECRNGRSAISGSTVVIGCSSGRVMVFRFATDELAVAVQRPIGSCLAATPTLIPNWSHRPPSREASTTPRHHFLT